MKISLTLQLTDKTEGIHEINIIYYIISSNVIGSRMQFSLSYWKNVENFEVYHKIMALTFKS